MLDEEPVQAAVNMHDHWELCTYRSNSKHSTTCTCLKGLEGLIVGALGLVHYLLQYDTWCRYGVHVEYWKKLHKMEMNARRTVC